MDAELIAYLDERFRETAQQIGGLREETIHRFEQVDHRFEQVDNRLEEVNYRFERVEGAIRETRVEIEGVRDDIRLVAEGITGVEEKSEVLRTDLLREWGGVRNFVEVSYQDLNRRVHDLETWKERRDRDPLEYIRERFGIKRPNES